MRALPAAFGNWHMICTRLRRWTETGVLDRMFAAHAGTSRATALNVVAALSVASSRSIRFFSAGSTPAAISFRAPLAGFF